MAASEYSQRPFEIVRDPVHGYLSAKWRGPIPEQLFQAQYKALLTEALRHEDRHFWLFDLSGHDWPTAAFERWFSDILAPQAAQALGHPVFVACVVDPGHAAHVNSEVTREAQVACAAHDLYTYFFDNRTDAAAWLEHQKVLDPGIQERNAR